MCWAWWVAGGGAGLPALEGPAGGRPVGGRCGGGEGGGEGQEGEEGEALVDFVVHKLKRDLFPDLMEFMG
jgi:hypothetical protein